MVWLSFHGPVAHRDNPLYGISFSMVFFSIPWNSAIPWTGGNRSTAGATGLDLPALLLIQVVDVVKVVKACTP